LINKNLQKIVNEIPQMVKKSRDLEEALVDEKNNLAAVADSLTEKIEKNKRVLDMRIDNLF
jgi:predicted  nucleic acid-binding Zn-ribbon protein